MTSSALRTLLILAFAVFGALGPIAAADWPEKSSATILTVETGEGAPLELDLTQIESLPRRSLSTTTPWQDGVQSFAGVDAGAFFKRAGFNGGSIRIEALDDYAATVPLSALEPYPGLLATQLNGEALDPEGFGPLWLVFPYDSMTDEERETYKGYSVWAIKSVKKVE